jgi:hypothetical protein
MLGAPPVSWFVGVCKLCEEGGDALDLGLETLFFFRCALDGAGVF